MAQFTQGVNNLANLRPLGALDQHDIAGIGQASRRLDQILCLQREPAPFFCRKRLVQHFHPFADAVDDIQLVDGGQIGQPGMHLQLFRAQFQHLAQHRDAASVLVTAQIVARPRRRARG